MTEKDFKELYPFDDRYVIVTLTGKEIKDAFDYLFSLKPDGSVMNGTFQYSKGFRLVVDGTDCWQKGCRVTSLTLNGEEFEDAKEYHVGMTRNCVIGCFQYFNLVVSPERQKVVSLSTYQALATYFLTRKGVVTAPEKGRFIFENFEG